MSFELVNHQIMHMFGGIEAEKNSSLESLQSFQRRLIKGMQKAQQSYKKIFNSIIALKQSFFELNDNYLSMNKQSKHSGKLITKLHSEITVIVQNVSEQAYSLFKKMQTKTESYCPNFKKFKQKYTQCADTLEHYKQKVGLLRKNVEKQSLANIKQDQHERFQRNKEKLRKAEKDHDQMLMKITKRYVEFNNEGLSDLYYDLLTLYSTFGSQIIHSTASLRKYLLETFSTKEILLAQEVKKKSQSKSKSEHGASLQGKPFKTFEQSNCINCDNKSKWLDHLISQQQLGNYLKTLMDKQQSHLEPAIKINQSFPKKEDSPKVSVESFVNFKNQYNNSHLGHLKTKLSHVKEEDPIDACQDLITVEELSAASPASVISNDENDIIEEQLTEVEVSKRRSSMFEQKMKSNLDKFNKICENNNLSSEKKAEQKLKQELFKLHHLFHNVKTPKNQSTVNQDEFFNIGKSSKKVQNQQKNQKKLGQLHEHPIDFDFLSPKPAEQLQPRHNNVMGNYLSQQGNNKKSKEQTHFEIVDFFGELSNSSAQPPKGTSNSSSNNTFDLLNF